MNFDTVPAWAYNACYYILAALGLFLAYSIWQVVKVYSVTKSVGATSIMGLGSLISMSIVGFAFMMNFWICRSALKA